MLSIDPNRATDAHTAPHHLGALCIAFATIILLAPLARADTYVINIGPRVEQPHRPHLNLCFRQVCQYVCALQTWWQAAPCPTYVRIIR